MKKVIIFVAQKPEKYMHRVVSDYNKEQTLNILHNFHGMLQTKQIKLTYKKEIPLNECLHCKFGDEFDKEHCQTCGGHGMVKKHIHKACRSRFNYPVCDPNNNMDNAMVTRRWEIVTCPCCLKSRKK